MCIILKSITESPKVAESDMTTYKVLEVVEDETTGKESYYSPLSQNRLQYNIGKLYTEPIGRTENVLGIEEGLETYICAKTTTGLYSYRDINYAVLIMLSLKCGSSDARYKIFQCKVPKGSKYYSSDKGTEIVSDNLEIVNQVFSLNYPKKV
jgi:hypothetical protein